MAYKRRPVLEKVKGWVLGRRNSEIEAPVNGGRQLNVEHRVLSVAASKGFNDLGTSLKRPVHIVTAFTVA